MNLTEHIFSSLPPLFQAENSILQGEAISFQPFVDGVLGLSNQININTANYGWLSLWGSLFGVPRNSNESDSFYRKRILSTLQTSVGTLFSIATLGQTIFGQTITVTDQAGVLGYKIILPANASPAQISAFQGSLAKVRPVGVPFSLYQVIGEKNIDTTFFVSGLENDAYYLNTSTVSLPLNISDYNINSTASFPVDLLTDPLLSS